MVSLCCDSQERDLNFLRGRVYELAGEMTSAIHKTQVVRDLQSGDVGYPTDIWSTTALVAATPNAWNLLTTFTVPDNTYVGIGDFFDLSTTPVVAKIRLGNASCMFRQFDLQEMWTQCEPHRVLDQTEQIIFGPGTTVNVEVYVSATDANSKFGMSGFVGEPAGVNISASGLIDP